MRYRNGFNLSGLFGLLCFYIPLAFAVPGQECGNTTNLPGHGTTSQVLASDFNRDGLQDLLAIRHGNSIAELYLQTGPRNFQSARTYSEVGFHPFDVIPFQDSNEYLLLAQGQKALRSFRFDDKLKWQDLSRRGHPSPRFAASFQWPKWGESMVISPKEGDILMLLPEPDPNKLDKGKRILVQKKGSTVPGEVSVVDIDGDGIDELVYTTRRDSTVWVLKYPGRKPEQKHAPVPVPLWKFKSGFPMQVAPLDFDRDGDIDLIAPLTSENRVAFLQNDGKGKFSPVREREFSLDGPPRVVQATLLADGRQLLVVSGDHRFYIYVSAPDGELIDKPHVIKMRGIPMYHRLVDLDGDDNIDLVAGLGVAKDSVWIHYGPLPGISKTTDNKCGRDVAE